MAHKDEKSYILYDIYPMIVPADTQKCITVKPAGRQPFNQDEVYLAEVYAREDNTKKTYTLKPQDGALKIHHFFPGEQEHLIHIYINEITDRNKKCIVHLYSLKEDLYNKRPYKGDFHIHSTCSDGNETPQSICALARQEGIDFMAITDHRKYQPSLYVQSFFADTGSDLVLFPGEEVHYHGREHIISYGAKEGFGEKYSGNDLFKKELEAFKGKIEKELNDLPENIDKHKYASQRFAIEKIRKAGGLSIMSHPYWIVSDGYHNAGELFKYMYENRKFDVFELLNGSICEEANNLQSAFYQQQRAEGNDLPVVSGTDAHTVLLDRYFGNMYTVVFSEDLEFETLRKNILDGFTSVVDESIPYAFGQFRMVKYALYLMREVFPLHDGICYEEGRLMYRHAAGDGDAEQKLRSHSGGVKKLYDRLWC